MSAKWNGSRKSKWKTISLDQPTFTDLEPRSAGSSNDGYIWKYLYTIKPSDIVKFESTDFIPVPQEWETSPDNSDVRNNAVDGSIKILLLQMQILLIIGGINIIYESSYIW